MSSQRLTPDVGALYRWHSLFIGVIRPIDVPGALTGIATFGA